MTGPLLPISTAREATALARKLLGQRPWVVAGCAAMFAVEGLAGLVAPFMLGRMVDVVVDGGSASAITTAVLWIVGAAFVGGLATFLSVALLARTAEPALADLRE